MTVEISRAAIIEHVETSAVADAAAKILVESDTLHDWFTEQAEAGLLA